MSLYQLQKLIFDVNRNPERRERYRADRAAFVGGYDLTPEESAAIEGLDIRTLYQFGVHPLLLRPFTLLHQISNEDYGRALKGLD